MRIADPVVNQGFDLLELRWLQRPRAVEIEAQPLEVDQGASLADAWIHNLPDIDLSQEPFVELENGQLMLDKARVEAVSDQCERFLNDHCPEFIGAARSFCSDVVYLPVSATGCSPELVSQGDTRFYGVRPSNIQPQWVTVPLVYAIRNILESIGMVQ